MLEGDASEGARLAAGQQSMSRLIEVPLARLLLLVLRLLLLIGWLLLLVQIGGRELVVQEGRLVLLLEQHALVVDVGARDRRGWLARPPRGQQELLLLLVLVLRLGGPNQVRVGGRSHQLRVR